MEIAGQRGQIIKDDKKEGGLLQFGTEIVTNKQKSLAALLGASPEASTSVSIMIEVLQKCYSEELETEVCRNKMIEMIPSFDQSLIEDGALLISIRSNTTATLSLE